MKLIVGLGNPGKEFLNTRHNIGFMFIDFYAEKYGVSINKEKFNGLYVKIKINSEDVILLKPQKYMNLSGDVIKKYVDYFNIDISDIIIICDDLNLDFLKVKLKCKGSCGGHNGLLNIENNLNTDCYKRLKIGISSNNNIDMKDYVLGKFDNHQLQEIIKKKDFINDILDDFLNFSFEKVMSKYNIK